MSMIHWAFDTEDDSRGTPSIFNFYDGTHHRTFVRTCFASVEEMRRYAWDWLAESARVHRRLVVWACNIEYDLLNLYGSEWIGKLLTLQYVSAGMIRATLREAPVMFLDTLRHWPASVEEMGQALGYPKFKRNFRSVAYCRRDTEIVWRYVQKGLKFYVRLNLSIRATLPAMALQLFKGFYHREFPKLAPDLRTFFRRGYFGGRVEVFRLGTIKGPVYHYDVNSLFPSVMLGWFPDLRSWRWVRDLDFRREGIAQVQLSYPFHAIPALPIRGEEEVVFPYGELEGVWTYPELRQAMQDGATIQRVIQGVEFSRREHPFIAFVEFCWRHRVRARSKLEKRFWKLIANSLYGKFGQHRGLDVIFHDRELTIDTEAAQSNVIWSAYVTAYARLELLRWLRRAHDVFYCDTDSIFTSRRLPVGNGLGELRQIGIYQSCLFRGNKIYAATNASGQITARAKGVKQDVALDFVLTGRAVFRRPARLRESRRTSAEANVWYQVKKELKAEYTKRHVRPDGTTVPWTLPEYRALVE